MKGRVLHFYLAGINNQNFLMRDRETGTWWQQITGKAIYGPLQGAALELVLSDELTFGQWRSESPSGKVLAPVAKYTKDYDSNWEPDVAKLPVVISFPGTELKARDVVVGLTINGAGRAYPWEAFAKQSPVIDRVNGTPRRHRHHGYDSIAADEAAVTGYSLEELRQLLNEESQRLEAQRRARRPIRYLYECPGCGKEYPRTRRYSQAVSCSCCDKRYNPHFRLRLKTP